MISIAPSILSADFARLAEELGRIQEGGANLVHVDVMDGHFVPNLTIGPPVIEALARESSLPLDCHLMIERADAVIGDYVRAGAARVTVHVEACPHLHRTVHRIREAGAIAGVAVNPATSLDSVYEILPEIGQILIMSVNPGFGGQRFIRGSLDKIARLAASIRDRGLDVQIEVDGGVTVENAADLVRAGARVLVAGSAIFGKPDPAVATRDLRKAAEAGL
ncbi:MAG: ribulose-phosphate 3-epimerase [Acidobacteriota bacterium]